MRSPNRAIPAASSSVMGRRLRAALGHSRLPARAATVAEKEMSYRKRARSRGQDPGGAPQAGGRRPAAGPLRR